MPDEHEGSGYNEVRIRIFPGGGTNYNLTVQSTIPVTRPTAVTTIDVHDAGLNTDLERIKKGTAGDELFEKIGADLFSWLFVGSIKTAYDTNLRAEGERKRGVRIVLEIAPEASELYQLPWSLIFDRTNGWLLGEVTAPEHQRTPLSFAVQGQPPLRPPEPQPLRILVVGANPRRLAPLDSTRDIEGLESGIFIQDRRVDFQARILSSEQGGPVTLERLQTSLESWKPHLLHFVCHGPAAKDHFYAPAGLFLQDEESEPIFYNVQILLGSLRDSGETVRQVVFNVCNSDGAAWKLAEQGIQAIGMVRPVSGNAAKSFASGLYKALARGFQIDEALNRARAAIRRDPMVGRGDWIVPALFLPQGRATFPPPPVPTVPATRLVRVESQPSGAGIRLGVGIGSDPTPVGRATPSDLELEVGRHYVIGVEKAGYRPAQREVRIDTAAIPGPLHFVLEPLPPAESIVRVQVEVDGSPAVSVVISWRQHGAGAESWIDLGTTDHQGIVQARVEPGRCEFRASPAGAWLAPEVVEAEIRPGINKIPIELAALVPSAVQVSSFPSGATVLLNGVPRAELTPAELEVVPGEYTLRLRKRFALALPPARRVRVGSREAASVWFFLLSPIWLLLLALPFVALLGQHLWATLSPAPPGMVRIPGGSYRSGGEDSLLLNLMREYAGNLDLSLVIEPRPGRGRIEQRFWIDRYEVTNEAYRQFLQQQGAGGRDYTPELWEDASFNGPRQPVVGVSWWDADAFCRWAGKRLPTADEWERAARGGGDMDRLYPWGDEFSADRANTGEGPEPRPVPGGQFETDRSTDGVYDLGGNVTEWTGTAAELEGKEGRISAGGSWKYPGQLYSLVFLRRAATQNFRSGDVGFRCARDHEADAPAPPDMVAIPPGEFRKGGPQSLALDLARRLSVAPESLGMILGEPPRTIEIEELYLDRHEVTNRDYGSFLKAIRQAAPASGDKEEDRLPSAGQDPQLNPPDHPVVGVDWNDAVAYCRWAGKRLPTADEWEAAARGQEGRNYPWGEKFEPERCNTAESNDGSGKTSPVGAHPECRTPEGVFDLVGNADEWTAGHQKTQDGRDFRVIKGGSWSESGEIRGLGWLRISAAPEYVGEDVGFRCAADPRRSWLQKLLGRLQPG